MFRFPEISLKSIPSLHLHYCSLNLPGFCYLSEIGYVSSSFSACEFTLHFCEVIILNYKFDPDTPDLQYSVRSPLPTEIKLFNMALVSINVVLLHFTICPLNSSQTKLLTVLHHAIHFSPRCLCS